MKVKSLRGILYLSFLILILITVTIIGIPMVNMIRNQVGKLAQQQTEQVLDHLEQSVDRTMGRIHRLSNQLTELERLRNFLSPEANQYPDSAEVELFLIERFGELVRIYDDVVALFAFEHSDKPEKSIRFISTKEGFEFNEENPLREQSWYVDALAADGDVVVTPPHLQNFIKRNYIWVVSLSRRLRNAATGQVEGILLIDINIDIIKDICIKNSTKTHYYYLVDGNGTLVFHPRQQLIYSGLFQEPVNRVLTEENETFRIRIGSRERIYSVREEPLSGWKIVAVTDVKELYAPFSPPLTVLMAWIGLGLVLLLVVGRLISTRILNPIRHLRESIKMVEEGRFDISVRVSDYDEVGALARDFNIMIRKIGDLLALNEEEHRKLRESDFKALQSQINPHFLYNTLDSVIWMTAKERKDDVITIVSSLSKLMRRSLATGDSMVPLEEEYDHARQYCIVQKIRYRDQLDYTMKLPEDCRTLPVPRLILQPLIENSLYHGIEDWDDGGEVNITSENHGDRLEITVSDNGVGADIGCLREILLGDDTEQTRSGVGLKNINDRLRILFGESAGMDFRSRRHHGLTVLLTIPLTSTSRESENRLRRL